ncbi:MAG: hypothetical protein APF81_10925 [Desulfosporosinus sp. BRH_c37]|nr:MAG: hypothetical protein APF81_10925 [Desulfosporosinus sp. BRH_c37]
MYSLPISTYSDYWRATKVWSTYLGGLAVFAAGTRYSVLGDLDINRMMQPTFTQIIQSLNTKRLRTEVSFSDPKQVAVSQDTVSQDTVSRGVSTQGEVSIDQQEQSSLDVKSPKQEVIIQNSKPVSKKKVIIQNSIPATAEGLELAKMNTTLTLTVESTAYTYTGNKTASGVEPREGLIAVDPTVIAMGSKVYVEGYGYAIAADTGGAIRGNRIDVFFPTLRQCIDWGRKSVHIYVLQPS